MGRGPEARPGPAGRCAVSERPRVGDQDVLQGTRVALKCLSFCFLSHKTEGRK